MKAVVREPLHRQKSAQKRSDLSPSLDNFHRVSEKFMCYRRPSGRAPQRPSMARRGPSMGAVRAGSELLRSGTVWAAVGHSGVATLTGFRGQRRRGSRGSSFLCFVLKPLDFYQCFYRWWQVGAVFGKPLWGSPCDSQALFPLCIFSRICYPSPHLRATY